MTAQKELIIGLFKKEEAPRKYKNMYDSKWVTEWEKTLSLRVSGRLEVKLK